MTLLKPKDIWSTPNFFLLLSKKYGMKIFSFGTFTIFLDFSVKKNFLKILRRPDPTISCADGCSVAEPEPVERPLFAKAEAGAQVFRPGSGAENVNSYKMF
jgi:hypothetical protein